MLQPARSWLRCVQDGINHLIAGPQALALLPAMVLSGFWLWGEQAVILLAIGLPLLIVALRLVVPTADTAAPDVPERLVQHLDTVLQRTEQGSLRCGCVALALDDFDLITRRHGEIAADRVSAQSQARIISALRGQDRVFAFENARFAIVIGAVRQLDTEIGLQIARRLQRAVEEPMSVDGITVYVSASLGLALNSHVEAASGLELHKASDLALREARRDAPSAIRVYRPGLQAPPAGSYEMQAEAEGALENGQIQPWFQPQISTDTGQITGFEALARWMHPDRGVISPPEFLPQLEQAGRMERLGEVMLYNALHALKTWDMAGLNIPRVGVNFAPAELRNPRLLGRIEWELDRFDLAPDRLMVEILETVVSTSPEDVVTRNINGLAALGCLIDLDDFGTGHASISSIRRFAVNRLKIDRSFVLKVDRDPAQQRLVSAILTMADRLELETLAEGVETAGEHAMLAQLGCQYVQGFGIARPMPFDKTLVWATAHLGKIQSPPEIGRKTG